MKHDNRDPALYFLQNYIRSRNDSKKRFGKDMPFEILFIL